MHLIKQFTYSLYTEDANWLVNHKGKKKKKVKHVSLCNRDRRQETKHLATIPQDFVHFRDSYLH